MPPRPEHYVGTELDLFAGARHWKSYFSGLIRPHLGRDVLEVGAGRGGTTAFLARGHRGRWLCLEPDPELARVTQGLIERGELPPGSESRAGSLATLGAEERFDSVLYIDVLEHIEDDVAEARSAVARLRSGGTLIVLAPAHQWLFSPFDRAIGHYRRYTRQSLAAVVPAGLEQLELCYLDSVGLLASVGNRFISRQSMPSATQVEFWDRALVPLSQWVDPVARHAIGKSVLGIWRRLPA